MPIKTFRGLLADGGTDRIALHHNDGKTGYKVVKFELMPNNPGGTIDSNVKIYKVPGKGASSLIDFSDNTLLGVAFYYNGTYETDHKVVFDNEIVNQDIYVVHHEQLGSEPMNYYIELEEMPLALDEATVATLKDIRNSGDATPTGG